MKTITKTANEVLILEFEFARALEHIWRPGKEYAATDYVRPTNSNGFEYECTDAGQTTNEEPDWPTTIASTIDDGSVVWTCRDFGTNGTDTISTETVTSDADITIGSASSSGTVVSATASGGSGCHEVVAQIITAAGATYEKAIRIVVS